jgi:hypothetical protein
MAAGIAASLPAIDYELLGSISGSSSYHYLEDAEQEHRLTGSVEAEATHRLFAKRAEVKAVTRYTADSAEGDGYEIPEAYLTLFPLAPVNVSLGKQKLNWGAANRYIPSDSLHVWEDAERQSFLGSAVSFAPTADASVTAALSVDESLDPDRSEEPIGSTLTSAVVSNLYFGNLQLTPSVVYRHEETLRSGLGASLRALDFIFYAEGAVELANDRSYPTGDMVSAGDGSGTVLPELEEADLWEPYPLVTAGLSRIFTLGAWDLSLIAEYLYAGTGYEEDESELLLETIAAAGSGSGGVTGGGTSGGDAGGASALLPGGMPRYWSQHYAYASLSLSQDNLGSLETTAELNAQDGSLALSHGVTVTAMDSVDFDLDVEWYAGESGESQFGTFPAGTALPGRTQVRVGTTVYF